MITDALIAAGAAILRFILSGLPNAQVPGWMTDAAGFTGTVFGLASSMGVWFPWTLAGIIVATLLATWAVAFGIKLARILLSLFTAGGGSAA